MDNVALRIAEILNQPVRIWMVLAILTVAGLFSQMTRIYREKNNEKRAIEGMTKRREIKREDKVKNAMYYPKFMRRKNRDRT